MTDKCPWERCAEHVDCICVYNECWEKYEISSFSSGWEEFIFNIKRDAEGIAENDEMNQSHKLCVCIMMQHRRNLEMMCNWGWWVRPSEFDQTKRWKLFFSLLFIIPKTTFLFSMMCKFQNNKLLFFRVVGWCVAVLVWMNEMKL